MKFPTVSGINLLRKQIVLPKDFSGEFNLLFVPFLQWQQMEVDSWVPLAAELEKTTTGFHFYELPTIQRMNSLAQKFINEGMRSGIPDSKTRERTITLYIDKTAFKAALDISDEKHISILLADRQGNLLWRERGVYSPETSARLTQAIQIARTPSIAG